MQTIKLKDNAFEELKLMAKANPSNEELTGVNNLSPADDNSVAYDLGLSHGFESGQRDLAKWLFDISSGGGAAEPSNTPITEATCESKELLPKFKVGDTVAFTDDALDFFNSVPEFKPIAAHSNIGKIIKATLKPDIINSENQWHYDVVLTLPTRPGHVTKKVFKNTKEKDLVSALHKKSISEAFDLYGDSELTPEEANTIVDLLAAGTAGADKVLNFVTKLIKRKTKKSVSSKPIAEGKLAATIAAVLISAAAIGAVKMGNSNQASNDKSVSKQVHNNDSQSQHRDFQADTIRDGINQVLEQIKSGKISNSGITVFTPEGNVCIGIGIATNEKSARMHADQAILKEINLVKDEYGLKNASTAGIISKSWSNGGKHITMSTWTIEQSESAQAAYKEMQGNVAEGVEFQAGQELTPEEANTIVDLLAAGVAGADKVLDFVANLIKRKTKANDSDIAEGMQSGY